jgi:hypothetical protein
MPTPSAKAALTSNTGHRRSRTVATLPPATPTRASGPLLLNDAQRPSPKAANNAFGEKDSHSTEVALQDHKV